MTDETATVARLSRRLVLQRQTCEPMDDYYNGRQRLAFLAPEVREQIGDRLRPLVINWPRTIVDSVQRRSYVEGFRVSTGGTADDELWRIWQANDLDEWAQLAFVDALVHRRSFMSVWNPDGGDTPRIAVESELQMTVEYEPGTRIITAALKRWQDGALQYATLYRPDAVLRFSAPHAVVQQFEFRLDGAAPLTAGGGVGPWQLEQRLPNPLGVVPVVPIVNRPRTNNLDGVSELHDVIPVADAVNKLATDMMVTSEYHATKRRWATGIEVPANPDNRVRLQAEVAAQWDNATKGKTWLAGQGVTFGEFGEASLSNFTAAIELLTTQLAAISGLPPHFLGVGTKNPASADAIRSSEATLVERAREKHRAWGGALEQVMRLSIAARDGVRLDALPPELSGMETIWRDPETPTEAQTADATIKLLAAGVIDLEAAQERMGLTPAQRSAISERRSLATATAATADVSSRMDLARSLQQNDGLSQNASLAAVGLLQAAAANSPAPRKVIERDPAGNIVAIGG